MPICKDKKLLFCHIGKTGGTSIEKSLGMNSIDNFFSFKKCGIVLDELSSLFSGKEKSRFRLVTPQHLSASHLKTILEDEWKDYYKFSVVRNPYTRMISSYYYVQRNPNPFLKDFKKISFEEYIEKAFSLKESLRYSIFDSHLCTQKSQLYINDELAMDKVYHFGNLTEFFNDFSLPEIHERKGNYQKPKDFLTKKSLEIINDFYDEDFKAFGYDKYYL